MRQILLVIVVVLAALSGTGRAELSKESKAEAKRLYLEGTSAYNLAEYPRAIAAYRAAYGIIPEPSLLFNIAQAYRQAGDAKLARTFYKNYLSNSPGAANRRQVEEKIAEMNELLAKQDRATSSPPIAPMDPDSKVVEPVQPTPLIRPEPAPVAVVVVDRPIVPVERKPIYKRWWLWTAVGGVVVVGVAVGVAVALTSNTAAPAPPSADFGTTRIFGLTLGAR